MSFAPFAAETCRTIRIYSRKHLMEDGYNQPSHRYPNKTSSVVSQVRLTEGHHEQDRVVLGLKDLPIILKSLAGNRVPGQQ